MTSGKRKNVGMFNSGEQGTRLPIPIWWKRNWIENGKKIAGMRNASKYLIFRLIILLPGKSKENRNDRRARRLTMGSSDARNTGVLSRSFF